MREGNDMGNYPHCIEEADYQADVYAILTCLAYKQNESKSISSDFGFQEHFLKLVKLAVETTFSFIQNIPFSRNQVRRVNRTLIWVFIYQIIKEKIEANPVKQFEYIIDILSKKPIIELYGPNIYSHNQRTFYNLQKMESNLWLGTFYKNEILRLQMPQQDAEKIISGIRYAKFDEICEGMSSFFEYVFRG